MSFSNPAARAAFFEKLKMKKEQAGMSPNAAPGSLAANITPKMPDISKIKLPKVSDTSDEQPMRFKKIKSFMKGY